MAVLQGIHGVERNAEGFVVAYDRDGREEEVSSLHLVALGRTEKVSRWKKGHGKGERDEMVDCVSSRDDGLVLGIPNRPTGRR